MTPDRKKTVNGHTVTEYYWNGQMVVYVDSRKDERTFEQALAALGGDE